MTESPELSVKKKAIGNKPDGLKFDPDSYRDEIFCFLLFVFWCLPILIGF